MMHKSRDYPGKYNWWWTSDFTQITGQALVTARVLKLISDTGGQGVTYNPIGSFFIVSWFKSLAKIWCGVFFGKISQLYLVCSRSNFGFIRDLPAYLLIFFNVKVIVHSHGSDIVNLCERFFIGGLARFFFIKMYFDYSF